MDVLVLRKGFRGRLPTYEHDLFSGLDWDLPAYNWRLLPVYLWQLKIRENGNLTWLLARDKHKLGRGFKTIEHGRLLSQVHCGLRQCWQLQC